MTWLDFISSLGGVCGLCLGVSFISVIVTGSLGGFWGSQADLMFKIFSPSLLFLVSEIFIVRYPRFEPQFEDCVYPSHCTEIGIVS